MSAGLQAGALLQADEGKGRLEAGDGYDANDSGSHEEGEGEEGEEEHSSKTFTMVAITVLFSSLLLFVASYFGYLKPGELVEKLLSKKQKATKKKKSKKCDKRVEKKADKRAAPEEERQPITKGDPEGCDNENDENKLTDEEVP